MKLTQKIFWLLMLVGIMTGCERNYDAPPLYEPIYQGPKANMTIAQVKENCKAATDKIPVVIANDWIVKAFITGNDESGNIYKQIFVQDATGAMPIQLDEGGVFATYRRGQEVFINLNGMCVSVYGGEQQLGWPAAAQSYYRMPMTIFKEKVLKNGWPFSTNVQPEVVTDISKINQDVPRMLYRLVQLEGVYFENGGKNTFATDAGFGEEIIKDAAGNTMMVRTSKYSSFAYEKLPIGKGTVVGILGRFNGTWQLTIPVYSDLFGFDGIIPDGGGDGGSEESTLFSETFGVPTQVNSLWPFLKDYTGFDNPSSMFSGDIDKLSARSSSSDGNVWFAKGFDYSLSISGISAKGATKATLIIKVGANTYADTESQDLNTLKVKCNGVELVMPSKVVTGKSEANMPFELKVEDVAVSDNTVLEFFTTAAINTYGLRLFDVKLLAPGTGGSGGGDINPVPGN